MYEVALETVPDVPAPEPLDPGTFEDWQRVEIESPAAIPELTVVALADVEAIGYATLGEFGEGQALHLMTGVKRA